ncbi:sulfite exporter TauE/SafE family protein [Rhodovulum sp. 12E13]|uniref:sulfite exporter TauE/SafE family protein n=1 Tax=Rhodovulum sp. 12E13 TaxID=2203891 RepID=UPI000E1848BE|nr:sulfite exporter TauE/SafE family protein [Rhodovulum sp. 12E13]RDC71423.1 sulfite exporter TauE/SafE family protein [Rhodovulum sp. 12E13]
MSDVTHLLGVPWLLAAVLAVVFVAAIVQINLGMGFGLTAAPLLALLDPALVPVPTLILGLFTASLGAWREREGIAWAEVLLGAPGRMAGVAAGAGLLALITGPRPFMLAFGTLIALALILSVSGWRMPFTRGRLLAMSALSGLMGTLTSVGAPPMALLYQHRPVQTARPTMAAFFAVGCVLSLAGLALAGWARPSHVLLAAIMAPGLLAGIFAARAAGRLVDRRFRPALLAVSGVAAAILVARGLGL